LIPSVGGTGPRGLTVRAPAARLAADARPSQPAPRIVTTRFAPHAGGLSSFYHNFEFRKEIYFCSEGLTPIYCFARRVLGVTPALCDQLRTYRRRALAQVAPDNDSRGRMDGRGQAGHQARGHADRLVRRVAIVPGRRV